jgi:hypothetical protein
MMAPLALTPLALTLLGLSAHAEPIAGAVQVRLTDDALDVAADLVEQVDPVIDEPDVGAAVSCWDRVGVRDFNLDVPIDLVGLSPGRDTLTLYVGFGDITGSDMTLYSEDTEYTDACFEFTNAIHEVAVRDAELVGTLTLAPDGEGFAVGWYSAPLLSADIETDFENVPDDLALEYFEDTLLDLITAEIEAALPPLLDDALAAAVLQGDYGDYGVDVSLVDVVLEPGSMGLGADGSVSFIGEAACAVPADPGAPGGRTVSLPLNQPDGAALGVGLTESFTNALLHTGWRAGAFCFGSETADTLADRLAVVVDPSIATFDVAAVLGAPPVLTVDDGAMRIRLTDLALTVTGRSDDGDVELVQADIDLSAAATVGFAPSLTALTLSLSDLDITFDALALRRILPAYESHVQPLLEDHLARWLEDELQQVPVFSSLYYALGLAIVVERAEPRDGGLELWMGLADPSSLDQVAPETTDLTVEAGRTSAALAWDGADDQGGGVVFSWQVDDGPWSAWTEDRAAEAWALEPGDHVARVKARDVWLNEDPTPAEAAFEISSENARRGGEGCTGCAGGPVGGPAAAFFAGLALLGLRRRDPVA